MCVWGGGGGKANCMHETNDRVKFHRTRKQINDL